MKHIGTITLEVSNNMLVSIINKFNDYLRNLQPIQQNQKPTTKYEAFAQEMNEL